MFWRRPLRLLLNLPPPIAESLERNPVRFAILSLIQRALLPRLMVLAPESLAIAHPRPDLVRHLHPPHLQLCRGEQIAATAQPNKCVRNGRLHAFFSCFP